MRNHGLHLNEKWNVFNFLIFNTSRFSSSPSLSQGIVFSQVYHGTIAVFRSDIHTHWAIPEKIQTSGRGWGHWISRRIEKNCGNSRVQLKKKWNFQGCSRKTHVKFPLVLIFDFGISKECHTILQNFQGWKLVFSRICKGTVTNLKISGWGGGRVRKVYLQSSPSCLDFILE